MTLKITEAQAEQVQRLVQSSCSNCTDGNCLLLDDGEPQPCVQLICTQAICCRFFREAVLPAEKELFDAIIKQNGPSDEKSA